MNIHDDGARRRQQVSVRPKKTQKSAIVRASQIIAYVSSTAVGASTFFGLRDYFQGDGVSGWVLSIIFAVSITAALAAVFHYLLELAGETLA